MLDLGVGGVIAVVASAIALIRIFRGPIGSAIGDRIRGSVSSVEPELLAELDGLKLRVADLEERLDFSERLLADSRPSYPVPGRAHR